MLLIGFLQQLLNLCLQIGQLGLIGSLVSRTNELQLRTLPILSGQRRFTAAQQILDFVSQLAEPLAFASILFRLASTAFVGERLPELGSQIGLVLQDQPRISHTCDDQTCR